MLVEDDCTVDTSGSSCSLVAMQLRGKKLSAEAEDTLEQEAHMLADSELAADEERQPYLCMIYPWLPQCAQQHPQTNYAPPPMPPMYNPMYNPMYQPPSPPPYNPMYQPPVMPSPPPYNPMYQPPVMPSPPSYHGPPASTVLSRRGGLDPPASVKTHNGAAWETMRVAGTDLKHIFAIGDWGSLIGVGSGAPKAIIQYRGGHTPGPHTMARHRGAGCTTKDMTACMGATGVCPANCHFKAEIDLHAQSLVATQMKKRAPQSNPDFVLNVGDNFYWGGIETECGHPMGQIHPQTRAQFNVIFEQVYNGPGLDGKPWLSVFGNHDLGGFQFNKAWDQQIAYTFASDRWRLPAMYWMQRVEYTDQGFAAEFLMIDSNAMDVKPYDADPEHNLCGRLHNPAGATCAATGGPKDLSECFRWFWDLWNKEQKPWVEQKLQASTADWQVIVTHFTCGTQAEWYKRLRQQFGLDLLVTGHTHTQQVFHNSKMLGGMTCFITGGGGGIVSEGDATPQRSSQYGFFDLTISKEKIVLESINHNGVTLGTYDVFPV
ncbi:Acp5 [Symbiodinium natans]|uniref:Acp5 protein n=1 Tax=Symbiodinium natans TaxID=878477 RepID=A0A812RLI1_9DINO|nr:Acp5 [Symbiodinium natans]